MNEILRTVRRVRRRILWNNLLAGLCRGTFIGSLLACAVIALHRLLTPGIPLPWLLGAVVAASIAVPVVLTFRRRPTLLEAAVYADLHNGLRERLSSAFALAGEDHPLAASLVSDARAALAGANRPIPFRPPLEGKLLFAPVLSALLLFSLLPEMDLLGMAERSQKKKEEKARVQRTAIRLKRRAETLKNEAEARKLDKALQVAKDVARFSRRLEQEGFDKKKAMVELSKLSDKVRKASRSKDYESFKNAFKRRSQDGVEPKSLSEKVLKAMERGGKSEAARELAKQLAKFQEQLAKDKLTDEDKKKLARQIKRLKQDFQIPPDLAKKLEKLAEALAKMQKDQKPGDRKYENAAQDLEELKKQLEELAKKLEDKEYLEKLLKQIEQAKKGMSGQGQKGQGQQGQIPIPPPGQKGQTPGTGGKKGDGKDGKGGKGKPEEDKDSTKFKDTYIGGKFDLSGKIVGISTFKGLPGKGEASAEYEKLYSQFKKTTEETLSKEKIPTEYKEYIKRYFDSIRPKRKGGK